MPASVEGGRKSGLASQDSVRSDERYGESGRWKVVVKGQWRWKGKREENLINAWLYN